ncbi:MAG: hypothetical protein SFZ03_10365 [Candidatus Melainabacteria bacterium]|nr:hypothetical protein [Candidatus Melainabacteria bacterium]
MMKPKEKLKNYNLADFTFANYKSILAYAIKKFEFIHFSREFFEKTSRQCVIWRHDIDFSLEAAHFIAKIEADYGISSTYFVNLHSDFYNLLEKRNTAHILAIQALGHPIGLHFDCHYYGIEAGQSLELALEKDRYTLENIIDRPVEVFSFHNPTEKILEIRNEIIAGMINTYAERFFTEIPYCSDSNGMWRHQSIPEVLESATAPVIQILTHPAFWVFDKPLPPKQKIWRVLEKQLNTVKTDYDNLLANASRANIAEDDFFTPLNIVQPDLLPVLQNLYLLGHSNIVALALRQLEAEKPLSDVSKEELMLIIERLTHVYQS